MPATRSHLTRPKPRQVVVDLGDGDIINVVFDSNRITPAWMRDAETRDSERDALSLSKALAEVIMRWEVTDDDGSVFEPNADNIAVLSYPAQAQLLERIIEAAIPSSAEGEGSRNTSFSPSTTSVVEPVSLPNGRAPSISQEPSTSPSST